MEDTEPLLRSAEAAKLCSVTPRTLRNWANSGLVTAQRTPTGERRYRRDDLLCLVTEEPATT